MMRNSIFYVAGGLILVAVAGHVLSETNAEEAAANHDPAAAFHAAGAVVGSPSDPAVERLLDRSNEEAQRPSAANSIWANRPADAIGGDIRREIARDLLEPLSSDPGQLKQPDRQTPVDIGDEIQVTPASQVASTPDTAADLSIATELATGDGAAVEDADVSLRVRAPDDASTSTNLEPLPPLSEPVSGADPSAQAVYQGGQDKATPLKATVDPGDIRRTDPMPLPRPREDSVIASVVAYAQPTQPRAAAAENAARTDAIGNRRLAQGASGNPKEIRRAQRLLAQLGYKPGQADGVDGPQTRSAVRAYQASTGAQPDGMITGDLLAALRNDAANHAGRGSGMARANKDTTIAVIHPKPKKAARSGDVAKVRRASKAKPKPKPTEDILKTWVAAATREIQRALGREFDSLNRPTAMRVYCRANPETWIYDEGRDTMVFCADVADGLTAQLNRRKSQGRR